jgi:predicted phosphate transport protein (TIGR00153 family)
MTMSPLMRKRVPDKEILGLLEEAGRNIQRTAMLLRDLIAGYPEHSELFSEIRLCEQEGDRITHDIIHRLNGGGNGLMPFGVSDGHALASALDDIVDYAEQAADMLAIYHVQAPMEQATTLCDILVGTTEQVANALRTLRSGTELGPHLVEIHRLENDGDRVSRDAIASLFAEGIDPMVVIRWKDIFEALESSVDACEKVAHVLEGIQLKK